MSEYQYYEFQAIDRPLTDEEQRAVSRLSSRVDPHPRQAVFVYHYSDLPTNAKQLLAKYYDAMFYIANWGTTQLMFRFPQKLVDVRQIEPYCVEDSITCETIGEYVILDILWNDEGGEYDDWVEGEGFLDSLISLREAILRQDYRVLYLAWLSAFHAGMMEEDEVEPPVPPGLQKLTPALRRFMEAFHVDEALVAAAAKASPTAQTPSPTALRQTIAALPREVCDEWLLRLAQGQEANLSLLFQRTLQSGRVAETTAQGKRTVAELERLAEAEYQHAQQKSAAAAEAKRIRELETLASKAEATWTFIEQLVEQGTGRSYTEATELLVKLHQLAMHQNKELAFAGRLKRLREANAKKRAWLSRVDKAGLP